MRGRGEETEVQVSKTMRGKAHTLLVCLPILSFVLATTMFNLLTSN